jgi:hypothetical protein
MILRTRSQRILFITVRTLDALSIQIFSEMCFRKMFSIVSNDECSNGDHCNSPTTLSMFSK